MDTRHNVYWARWVTPPRHSFQASTRVLPDCTVPRSRSIGLVGERVTTVGEGGKGGAGRVPIAPLLSPTLSASPTPPPTLNTDRAPCRLFDFDLPPLGR